VSNPSLGDAYLTALPRPLNAVEPLFNDWFRLGDGTLVRGADEVERIYREQQQLMSGAPDDAPAGPVRSVDRLKDGFIPRAEQLEKNAVEKDATCHPNGGWKLDPNWDNVSERSRRYQAQITRAPRLDYVVRAPDGSMVKFDGCAVWDPDHPLLEAKGHLYGGLIPRGMEYPFFRNVILKDEGQAERQSNAASGRPIEWHIAAENAIPYFEKRTEMFPEIQTLFTAPR
jgi:hypothetical protein